MAIAFVQSKTAQTTSAASVTTAAITTTSGNFIGVGVADLSHTPGTSGVTDSKSNSYTRDVLSHATTTPGVAVYHSANITGGASHTFTYTPPANSVCSIAVGEFSGLTTSAAVDQTVGAVGVPTNPQAVGPTGTTTAANELLLAVMSQTANRATIQSTVVFADVILAASGSQEGVILSHAVLNNTRAIRYRAQVTAANEGIGLATYKGSAPAFVQSKTAQANATSVTTAAMTTTSGNCLQAVPAAFARTFSGSPISDSKSNTWSNAWLQNGGTNGHAANYYSLNISGGSSHTVTYTSGGASDFLALAVGEFSGINTSSAIDQTATVATGAVTLFDTGLTSTLAQATESAIGGCSYSHSSASAASFGFAPDDWSDVAAAATAAFEGICLSYLIASSTGAYTVYISPGNVAAANDGRVLATYKASVAGGTLFHRAPLDGLGAGGSFFDNPLSRT